MTFTYDLGTPAGGVRLLIPDRVAEEAVFDDAEISYFLSAEGGNVKGAAALALETISSDEALVQKVMKAGPLTTDGAALAKALMARATELRKQAAVGVGDTSVGAFGWAELVTGPFSRRERLADEVLRHNNG